MLVNEKTAIYLSREPGRREKSRNFVHVCGLTTRKILRRRNAQCNTEESPQELTVGVLVSLRVF